MDHPVHGCFGYSKLISISLNHFSWKPNILCFVIFLHRDQLILEAFPIVNMKGLASEVLAPSCWNQVLFTNKYACDFYTIFFCFRAYYNKNNYITRVQIILPSPSKIIFYKMSIPFRKKSYVFLISAHLKKDKNTRTRSNFPAEYVCLLRLSVKFVS